MVKIDKVIAGASEYVKDKLYPSLDSVNRMKISAALSLARLRPDGALKLMLIHFLPNTTVEKALESAAVMGIVDGKGNVDVELLLDIAKAHIQEFGELGVNLFGIEFDLSEANIEMLGDYIKKAG